MKIEKINDDKIKITFDYIDLQENNIDFHSFMANSTQTQALFLKILDQAEESLGFNTDQYKLEINTLALSNGIFILIVTRLQKETKKKVVHVHTKRKSNINNPTFSIYKFNSFDNFISFCQFIVQNSDVNLLKVLENNNSLFKYNSQYFFAISTTTMNIKQKEFLFSCITEFAKFVTNSKTFLAKLKENTTCFLDKNAINSVIHYIDNSL